MRLSPIFLSLCLILAMFLFSSEAMAIGFGVYGMVGKGEADWEEDVSGLEISTDFDRFGGGVVLEFGTTASNLFNYRVSLGYERSDHEIGTIDYIRTDAVVMTHDLGIALVRLKDIRLWFGPELYLSYSKDSPENFPELDIEMLGVGGGPVLGLDLNHPDSPVNINFQGGYIHTRYEATGEVGNFSTDYTLEENHYFVRFLLIYRLGE